MGVFPQRTAGRRPGYTANTEEQLQATLGTTALPVSSISALRALADSRAGFQKEPLVGNYGPGVTKGSQTTDSERKQSIGDKDVTERAKVTPSGDAGQVREIRTLAIGETKIPGSDSPEAA